MNKPELVQDTMVEMLVRNPSQGVLMEDNCNSAHQFSIRNRSVQADSEARMEAEDDLNSLKSCRTPVKLHKNDQEFHTDERSLWKAVR
jgi:hypothetical protein